MADLLTAMRAKDSGDLCAVKIQFPAKTPAVQITSVTRRAPSCVLPRASARDDQRKSLLVYHIKYPKQIEDNKIAYFLDYVLDT